MEKILYDNFLKLPENDRRSCSIAQEWKDEKGRKWVAVFLWAKAERLLQGDTLPDDLYLEFYNLDNKDDDACLQFIEKYYIIYVGEHQFDDSGAFKYTIDNLRFDLMGYRADFDLFAEGADSVYEALIRESKVKSNWGETAFWSLHRINENLERCHPKLKIKIKKDKLEGYYYQSFECKDFLSLCYWQVFNMVINHETNFRHCVSCGKLFGTTRRGKIYCSNKCQKRKANQRQRNGLKADTEKHEKYKKERREYMRKYRRKKK